MMIGMIKGRQLGVTAAILAVGTASGTLFAEGELSPAASRPAKVTTIAVMDTIDTSFGHAFHAGHLWAGRNVIDGQSVFQLDVYEGKTLEKRAQIPMPHSIQHVYPYATDSVLVVGRKSWPWKSYYSVVKVASGRFSLATTVFPEEYQVDQFGGGPGAMFFTEPGERSVLAASGTRLKPVGGEISGPGRMTRAGDFLFVIEGRAMGVDDENIVRIDINGSGEGKRVFTEFLRQGVTDILWHPAIDRVITTERSVGQLLLIHPSKNTLDRALNVGGAPRSLARYGKCVAATNEAERSVTFVDVTKQSDEIVAVWTFENAGPSFARAQGIAVDESTGRVFVRSFYPCAGCRDSTVRVVAADDPSLETMRACGLVASDEE